MSSEARATGMDVILLYHRIANDGWPYSVRLEHFVEHLDVLRAEAAPATLAALAGRGARAPSADERPRVAITFDDGYAETGRLAWPLLARAQWPATVFVVSGHLGRREEFWWDQLEWLVHHAGIAPHDLRVRIGDRWHAWTSDVPADPAETVAQTRYRLLHDALAACEPHAQQEALDALIARLGVRPPCRPARLPVDHAQLRAWTRESLVDIGAHTSQHVMLPKMPLATQAAQIADSRRVLQEVTNRPVDSFSYPYGRFTPDTCGLVRAAGFARACKVGSTPVTSDRPFTMPRFTVRDWDGQRFASHLHAIVSRQW